MLKFLIAFLLSSPAFAMGDGSMKALDGLAKCLPDYNFSCALAGTCTREQFCSACTAVNQRPTPQCQDKTYVYAAVEGLFQWTEGSCKQECGIGTSLDYFRAMDNTSAGDEVTVAQNRKQGAGLGIVVKANGQVSLAEVSYSGKTLPPGTTVTLRDDAVAQPIQESLSCIRGSSNAALVGCFTKFRSCGRGMKPAARCALCTATTSCSGAREFFKGTGELSCSGC
jgi:hypothetical protein